MTPFFLSTGPVCIDILDRTHIHDHTFLEHHNPFNLANLVMLDFKKTCPRDLHFIPYNFEMPYPLHVERKNGRHTSL